MRLQTLSALFCFGLLVGCKSPQSSGPAVHASTSTAAAPQPSAAAPPSASAPPDSPAAQGDDPTKALENVTAGERDFAVRLYGQLRSQPGNLFISPASVRVALGMTYAGAAGETKAEMAKVLKLGEDAHQGFSALLSDWNARGSASAAGQEESEKTQAEAKRFVLRITNRLWGEKTVQFRPEFLQVLQGQYRAPLEALDFHGSPEPSRTTINQWVETQTERKIKDLLAPGLITKQTSLVLTNAVYFKASWAQEFPEKATAKEAFFVGPKKTVQVPMMHLSKPLSYADITVAGVPAKALSLAYQAPDLMMLVIVPEAKDGLAQVEEGLRPDLIQETLGKLQRHWIDLAMPKFKTTSAFDLVKTLSAMGMPSAFDAGKADFSGMDGTRQIVLSAVVHKAFVAVDEKGTEAAAATAVVGLRSAALAQEPVKIRLDHPFVYMIVDRRHSSILFLGRLADPSKES